MNCTNRLKAGSGSIVLASQSSIERTDAGSSQSMQKLGILVF